MLTLLAIGILEANLAIVKLNESILTKQIMNNEIDSLKSAIFNLFV
jgi:hypothetical protein